MSRIEKDKVFLEGNGQEYEIALYGEDKPRKAVSVPDDKPTVIAPAGDEKRGTASASTAGEKTGGTPPASGTAPGKKGKAEEEFETIDTPFGKMKIRKK